MLSQQQHIEQNNAESHLQSEPSSSSESRVVVKENGSSSSSSSSGSFEEAVASEPDSEFERDLDIIEIKTDQSLTLPSSRRESVINDVIMMDDMLLDDVKTEVSCDYEDDV